MRLCKILLLLSCVALCSCSVTRGLSDGEYLLSKVEVSVADADSLSRKERVQGEELYKYVKQTPNKRFLGTNFYAWMYSLANPEKEGWLSRLVRKIGEEPVIYDSTLCDRSVRDMDLYMYGRGFLRASTGFTLDTAKKRAKVQYTAIQSEPYRIGSIKYNFRDDFLGPIILADQKNSLIRVGDIFDINELDKERGRIAKVLNNDGMYNFKVTNISYVADSSVGDRKVDLEMVVYKNLDGYTASGQSILENSKVYRINKINVFPDFQPAIMAADSGSVAAEAIDTLNYQGLHIISNNKDSYRPVVLRELIGIQSSDKYNAEKIQQTYDALMGLGYFKTVSIVFTDVTDSTSVDNLISYKDVSGGDTTEYYTQQGLLNCNIVCTPGKRQSYTMELEGTTASTYYGIMTTLGYQNRNIFKGFELLDISLTGGYEFLNSTSSDDSFQIGGTVSLSFPRFIHPPGLKIYDGLKNAITKLEFSYDVQRRPYYHRTLSSAAFGYQWSAYRHENYVLKPIDISVVKLKYIDEDYLESLDNPYLINSYQSQLIGGISGSYIYNNSVNNTNLNFVKWRVNLETNGNLISAFSSVFSDPYTSDAGETYNRLFGIRYAQYVRGDVNYAKSFYLGPQTSLVYRFYTGAGFAYGNSTSIPYERLFFCGGSNSMRGWQARTLGPGSTPEPEDVVYDSQLGDFRLETNLEARFPVWGMFKGAVFFDLGNVWFLNEDDYDEDGVFHFNDFYKQLGFNTGLGLRMDFNFFVFRLDWGIKLHNPNKPVGERWISNLEFRNTTLNFGVGYPF
ncbi:MAG: BamA/TamA family outer membrane protein [Rikenellaceae bacterium]